MTISIRTVGSWVAATATTQTVTLPTHADGDMLIVRVVGKGPATLSENLVICSTSGWAGVASMEFGGTSASSNGGGSVWARAFYKVAASSSETNPVLTFENPVGTAVSMLPSAAVALSYQKAADESWSTPVSDAGPISAATSYYSACGSAGGITAGDMLDAFVGTNDNTTLTVPTLNVSGVTLSSVTEAPATALSSATSNDISADGLYVSVTAGSTSNSMSLTGTNSVADEGVAWITKLRVTAAGFTITSAPTTFGWSPAATLAETFIVASSDPAFGWAPNGTLSWPLPITIDSGGGAFGWSPAATLSETFALSGGAAFGWSPAATLAETFALSGGAVFGWGPDGVLDAVANSFDLTGGTIFGWLAGGELAVPYIAIEDDRSGAGPHRKRREQSTLDDWTILMDDDFILELYLLGKTR